MDSMTSIESIILLSNGIYNNVKMKKASTTRKKKKKKKDSSENSVLSGYFGLGPVRKKKKKIGDIQSLFIMITPSSSVRKVERCGIVFFMFFSSRRRSP